MKMDHRYITAVLALAAMLFAAAPGVHAANTASGTVINNTATVNYQVGGVAQNPVSGSASFWVDNKVNVLVTNFANATVVPGSTDRVLSFTVTNLGNTTQRYALSLVSRATDSFNMNNVRIYRDIGAAGYDGGDTLYADASTFGDVASGATLTVLVVADTPAGQVNGEVAWYDLVATTVNAGTLVVTTQTAGANTLLGPVDVVFADVAGSWAGAGNDEARDGKHSALGIFTVSAAAVTVSKSVAVYRDPFNDTTNPKAIPGATITYIVVVNNAAGGSAATSVTVTDDLSVQIGLGRIAFNPDFNDGAACPAGSGIVVDAACKTNTNGDGDGANFNANIVTATLPNLASGATSTVKYQVIVQ